MDLRNSGGAPSRGPECVESLGFDSDESDASGLAVSGDGTSKVSCDSQCMSDVLGVLSALDGYGSPP